ncbi:hypothetical protein SPOG_02958 [Schizosaccharomyces cryophilus OY26]|uniref:Uncharacterized protein n=1 Tax=Schizosaccharomyces cryophilus (strain OY26 / ATCC MYA-4695 / CBS 11777 / NBRC 106824 / NRRL Y48691) TaxID=653667 RepID=S9W5F5_SCHCR|nr:uncharacterized protein SPOG_02958 [Schizosaccharomyces cryophilus OY26]EPY53809.1 hypothetical protein SPOG_02958 [Schizosaccharomyces cryophilus OY26]
MSKEEIIIENWDPKPIKSIRFAGQRLHGKWHEMMNPLTLRQQTIGRENRNQTRSTLVLV